MEESTNTVNLTWRPSKNGPEDIDEPVLCLTSSKKLIVLRDTWTVITNRKVPNWGWLSEKYSIEWWTYTKEIII
jgi:hypothetical protein